MPTVLGTLVKPNGDPAEGTVSFFLMGDNGPVSSAVDSTTGNTIVTTTQVDLASGAYTVALTGNDDILPANTVWARTYGRTVDTLEVPAAGGPYDESDILADPPAALDPSGLAVHAADTSLHGGGLSLGVALLTEEVAVTDGTAVDIEEGTLSFIAPDRDYVVEFVARLNVATSGAIGNVQLHASVNLASFTLQGNDGIYATTANTIGIVRYALYVPGPAVASPNSPAWHVPVPGDTVDYKLRLQRVGGTGTVTMTPDNVFLGKSLGYIRAYTV